jgi:signal transduction histidine kinase
MMARPPRLERYPRPWLVLASLGLLAGIGVVDYLSGFEILFSVFYLLAVGSATWFVGKGFGLLLSLLSVAVWIGGDVAAGAQYSSALVPVWNAVILTTFYFIIVWLLTSLRSLHYDMEDRVRHRTLALAQEMAERQRLEREILTVGERERQHIGRELHDSLCQHLTGTALAAQVLGERLAARSLPEAAAASGIVQLVEDGIALARDLARGLYPVDMEAGGLMAAFQDLAANLSQAGKVLCRFQCDQPVLIHDSATATHLFRVAQEAVFNAVRHGKARTVVLSLSDRGGDVTLMVEDDGVGLPEVWPPPQGLGIRIMAHRAALIGAALTVEPAPTGGTIVSCTLRATPSLEGGRA